MFIVFLWFFFYCAYVSSCYDVYLKYKILAKKKRKIAFLHKMTAHYCASCFLLIPTFFCTFFIFFLQMSTFVLSRISSLTCYTPHAENNIKTFDVSILFAIARVLLPTHTHYTFLFILYILCIFHSMVRPQELRINKMTLRIYSAIKLLWPTNCIKYVICI